ncbi:MAG: DUF1800 family protein [Acidimicrobiia bacterium]
MADDRALIAHILRRTSFGPLPGQVDRLAALGVDGVLDNVLAAVPRRVDPPNLGSSDDRTELVNWWTKGMASQDAGLHEKLVWFWHGHFTSSYDKTQVRFLWGQQQLFRKYALGNFRAMCQAITVDAAMLGYLDGDGSKAEAPNQNYARELMELFTMGRGGYTEADIAAAAVALSGWVVDDNKGSVKFSEEDGPSGPVSLLGKSGVRDAKGVVDIVCDHPSTAAFIVSKLHRYFVGTDPSDERRAELAKTFRDTGLEIRPVVENILRHPTFMGARYNRPRFPMEWITAASGVLGERPGNEVYDLLGQEPFNPPNVAGWPVASTRWLSTGAYFVKAEQAMNLAQDTELGSEADPVDAVLQKASIYDASDTTIKALRSAASQATRKRDRATLLHALVVVCPEFQMA